MADIGAIRAGIAANLGAIAEATGCQVSAYMLANPTPPAFDVVPGESDFDAAMGRGLDLLEFVVTAFVGLTSDVGAQQQLDEFLAGSGPMSVKAAIETADAADGTNQVTLGGACSSLSVTGASRPRALVKADGTQLLMAEWTVEVRAEGD